MKKLWRKLALWAVQAVVLCYAFWIGSLVLFRWVTPPTTGVHVQRRVESWFAKGSYEKRFTPVPLGRISPHLAHAVIAGEDGRFYTHWGLDLEAMADAALELTEAERDRTGVSIGTGIGGASTQDVLYRRYYAEKIPRAHPFSIPRTMNSAGASQVAMAYGLRGPGICISTACASAGHSIGEAFEMIRGGRADMMLAGGSDASVTAPPLPNAMSISPRHVWASALPTPR